MEFLSLKPEAFGIDISDLSLKIVKLKKKGRFFDLACFGEAAIKPGIIEKGEILNDKELVNIIKKSLKEIKGERLGTKHVIASLPEEKAFLQVIKLPRMTEEEAKKAVYFEAENYVPLPIKDVYLDCQMVTKIHNHEPKIDVLMAALPKKTVDPYVKVLKTAGLSPLALEIESQAISQALVKGKTSSKPFLLIDLGATRTSFIIFFGSSLRFTSSVPISSNNFTKTISKSLKIDSSKAEALKIKQGITNKETLKALWPDLTDLAQHVEKCLNYCQTRYKQKVNNILLCGGGANLNGLTDFLSSKIKVPIALGNPWVNILDKGQKQVKQMPYQESLRYTTALGLGLRGVRKYV